MEHRQSVGQVRGFFITRQQEGDGCISHTATHFDAGILKSTPFIDFFLRKGNADMRRKQSLWAIVVTAVLHISHPQKQVEQRTILT